MTRSRGRPKGTARKFTPERRAVLAEHLAGIQPGTAAALLARVNAMPGDRIASVNSLKTTLTIMRRELRAEASSTQERITAHG